MYLSHTHNFSFTMDKMPKGGNMEKKPMSKMPPTAKPKTTAMPKTVAAMAKSSGTTQRASPMAALVATNLVTRPGGGRTKKVVRGAETRAAVPNAKVKGSGYKSPNFNGRKKGY